VKDNGQLDLRIEPGVVADGRLRAFDSIVLNQVSLKLPAYADYRPEICATIVTPDSIRTILEKDVVQTYSDAYAEMSKAGLTTAARVRDPDAAATARLQAGVVERQLR
jgi:hypothetical protein